MRVKGMKFEYRPIDYKKIGENHYQYEFSDLSYYDIRRSDRFWTAVYVLRVNRTMVETVGTMSDEEHLSYSKMTVPSEWPIQALLAILETSIVAHQCGVNWGVRALDEHLQRNRVSKPISVQLHKKNDVDVRDLDRYYNDQAGQSLLPDPNLTDPAVIPIVEGLEKHVLAIQSGILADCSYNSWGSIIRDGNPVDHDPLLKKP